VGKLTINHAIGHQIHDSSQNWSLKTLTIEKLIVKFRLRSHH